MIIVKQKIENIVNEIKMYTNIRYAIYISFLAIFGIFMCLFYINSNIKSVFVEHIRISNSRNTSVFYNLWSPLKKVSFNKASLNESSTKVNKKFIVLYWTMVFGKNTWRLQEQLSACPEWKSRCEFTSDRSLQAHRADMLLVHMRDKYDTPARPAHQKWVFSVMESPINVHVNLAKERWRFNLTMTYRLDSTFLQTYGGCEPYPTLKPLLNDTPINYAKGKEHVVAWFVHNCYTNSRRMRFVNLLKKHTNIHKYGCGGSYSCPRSRGDYCVDTLLHHKYKFYLAFENSFCKDYVTEKLFKIIGRVNVVPVVAGYYDYEKLLPPHSFINVKDFKSAKALADYLNLLDQNDTLYNEYFAWKRTTTWRCGGNNKGVHKTPVACKICEYGIKNRDVQETVNIEKFWGRDSSCTSHDAYFKGV